MGRERNINAVKRAQLKKSSLLWLAIEFAHSLHKFKDTFVIYAVEDKVSVLAVANNSLVPQYGEVL